MKMADFTPPAGRVADAALQLAHDHHSPAMLNHVARSWYWACGYAALKGLEGVNSELLYVAAMLHDLGTTKAFDNQALSYEEAGGHAAVAFAAGAGWSRFDQQRVLDVIVRHNWPAVDPALDLEGHLLEVATGLDITGAHAELLPAEFIQEVLVAHPRLSIADEFTACVTDQARRKPGTAAFRIVNSGLSTRMQNHPFEALS